MVKRLGDRSPYSASRRPSGPGGIVYRGLQVAVTVRIADGASEILCRTIAQELFRGSLDWQT